MSRMGMRAILLFGLLSSSLAAEGPPRGQLLSAGCFRRLMLRNEAEPLGTATAAGGGAASPAAPPPDLQADRDESPPPPPPPGGPTLTVLNVGTSNAAADLAAALMDPLVALVGKGRRVRVPQTSPGLAVTADRGNQNPPARASSTACCDGRLQQTPAAVAAAFASTCHVSACATAALLQLPPCPTPPRSWWTQAPWS